MEQKKTNAEELAVMVEDATAKLSGEDKTDFLLKIVIILLVALMDSFGSHDERATTQLEAEITCGLFELLSKHR